MADRNRWRRRRQHPQSILPLQLARNHPNTLSFWYCDVKITAFNEFIFSLGRRYQRFLQVWFSIGIGFSTMALIGIFLILLWDFVCVLYFWNPGDGNLLTSWLLGMSQSASLNLSLMDFGVMVYSTLVSVVFHEFGHALAAASQGIQVEYVAMFLAVIFPGAFVAFNYNLLQNSTLLTSLRVYCAGIWHNVVLCAVCAWMLLFLPSLLHPLYIHAEGALVLYVAPMSPLSSYLSQGDVVVSLDGTLIRNPQEWAEKLVQMNSEMNEGFYHSENSKSNSTFLHKKGYCIPTSWVEESRNLLRVRENFSCPEELSAFASVPCTPSSLLDPDEVFDSSESEKHCLAATDIVKVKKCGDGWGATRSDKFCACQEGEFCMAPVQIPGMIWVEISFSRPYSSECLRYEKNKISVDPGHLMSESTLCGGVFVFIGDAISLVNSITLSAYRPRWAAGVLGFYLPNFCERVLSWMLHISASLALFNSLPAFFLDGESILETLILQISFLRSKTRQRVLWLVLYAGTILSVFAFFQIFWALYRKPAYN